MKVGYRKKSERDFFSTWKKRYFLFTSDGEIAYYSKEREDKKGSFKVANVTEMKWLKNDHFGATGFKFNIFTPTRVYELWSETLNELSSWMKTIALFKLGEILFPEDLDKVEGSVIKEHYEFGLGCVSPTPLPPLNLNPARKNSTKNSPGSKSPRSGGGGGSSSAPKPLPKSPRKDTMIHPDLQCSEPEKRTMNSLHDRNMQIMAFVGWINYKLKDKSIQISDLNQLSDGNVLVHLVEEIIGERPPDVVLPVATTRDKMQNLSSSIAFFSSKYNIQMTSVSVPMLLSGNIKVLMDLIWDIIYYSSIKVLSYDGLNDRFALFKWVQHRVAPFQITIKDFTTSFADGQVFLALLHSYHPGIIDIDSLTEYKVAENVRLAFKLASEHWGVPKLLDPTDIVSGDIDQISVIVYLSICYFKFV
eukprot:TRINITY_DN4639_c0_g2_i1.p1 TRINITY_DN4639_c0_g2~~TRINITY_DN4639_c0_g2_i1.p1  ORF type:complete len:418 (-),score=95.61 TRINITY_DN4639_c0_g2_i1:715-1968(-)